MVHWQVTLCTVSIARNSTLAQSCMVQLEHRRNECWVGVCVHCPVLLPFNVGLGGKARLGHTRQFVLTLPSAAEPFLASAPLGLLLVRLWGSHLEHHFTVQGFYCSEQSSSPSPPNGALPRAAFHNSRCDRSRSTKPLARETSLDTGVFLVLGRPLARAAAVAMEARSIYPLPQHHRAAHQAA